MLIDFDLSTYLIALIILIGFIIVLKKKFKKSNIYIFCFSIFFIYIINVIKYTIFPIEINTPFVTDLKEQLSMFSRTNLIPFKFQEVKQTFLNIILTMPFGFGLPYIKNKINYKTILIWSALFSLSLELCQFIISLIIGYPYRVTDINDILANTLGAIIGYLFFKLFSLIVVLVLNSFTKKNEKLTFSPFLSYIYDVSKLNN